MHIKKTRLIKLTLIVLAWLFIVIVNALESNWSAVLGWLLVGMLAADLYMTEYLELHWHKEALRWRRLTYRFRDNCIGLNQNADTWRTFSRRMVEYVGDRMGDRK